MRRFGSWSTWWEISINLCTPDWKATAAATTPRWSSTGKKSNLHRFWDSDLLDENVDDEDAFAAQLSSEISLQDEQAWSKGHLQDWTWESRQLALAEVYGPLPDSKRKTLDEAYTQKAWEITKEQLQKAGVRLAVVMNEMWGY